MKMIKYTHPALTDMVTDEPQYYSIPSTRIVCPRCNGYGTHTRCDLDESRLVESMQEDGDYYGLNAYHNGAYDETCNHCEGAKVIDQMNWEYFEKNYPEQAKQVVEYEFQASEDRRYEAMERRALGY